MQDYSTNFYQIPAEAFGESVDLQTIEEDLKTFAHNAWTRTLSGGHWKNNKRWDMGNGNPLAIIKSILTNKFNFTDKIDKKYFDSMYTIKQPVADKLRSWVKSIPDAYIITSNKEGNLNKHMMDISGKNGTASHMMRLATRSVGQGATTTATCFYKLSMDKGHAILYFTFDGNSIEDCKLLCLKQGSDPKDEKNYYVKELTEWKTVTPEEYKK